MSLRTEYEFTLPRGYVDPRGGVHRVGIMRLATARDELEPLRHPTIQGPDDPRLTVLILGRVVTKLGTLPMVTSNEIEELFAADLAYLQDFYGVINFGTQEEYEAFLAAQQQSAPVVGSDSAATGQAASASSPDDSPATPAAVPSLGGNPAAPLGATVPRSRIEEIPREAN